MTVARMQAAQQRRTATLAFVEAVEQQRRAATGLVPRLNASLGEQLRSTFTLPATGDEFAEAVDRAQAALNSRGKNNA